MEVPKNILNLIKMNKITFSKKSINYLLQNKYSIIDFKNSVINGYIKKKERDELHISNYKYTIIGPALNGQKLYTCGKIISIEDKQYFFITLHKAD